MTQRRTRRSPFAGHGFWWWASAAICAIAVVGAVVLLAF